MAQITSQLGRQGEIVNGTTRLMIASKCQYEVPVSRNFVYTLVLPDWLTKPNFCQTGFAELTNPEDEFNQAKDTQPKEKLKTKIQGIKFRKENPVMNTWDSPADTVGPTRKF